MIVFKGTFLILSYLTQVVLTISKVKSNLKIDISQAQYLDIGLLTSLESALNFFKLKINLIIICI